MTEMTIWNKNLSLCWSRQLRRKRGSGFSPFTLYLIDFPSASPSRPNSPEECKNNWTQTKAIFGGKIEAPPRSSIGFSKKEENLCERQVLLKRRTYRTWCQERNSKTNKNNINDCQNAWTNFQRWLLGKRKYEIALPCNPTCLSAVGSWSIIFTIFGNNSNNSKW